MPPMERLHRVISPSSRRVRKKATHTPKTAFEAFCRQKGIVNTGEILWPLAEAHRIGRDFEQKHKIQHGGKLEIVPMAKFYEFVIRERFGEQALMEYFKLLKPAPEKKKPAEKKPESKEIVISRKRVNIRVVEESAKHVRIGGINAMAGMQKKGVTKIIIFIPPKRNMEAEPLFSVWTYRMGGSIYFGIRDFKKQQTHFVKERVAKGLFKELIEIHKSFRF